MVGKVDNRELRIENVRAVESATAPLLKRRGWGRCKKDCFATLAMTKTLISET